MDALLDLADIVIMTEVCHLLKLCTDSVDALCGCDLILFHWHAVITFIAVPAACIPPPLPVAFCGVHNVAHRACKVALAMHVHQLIDSWRLQFIVKVADSICSCTRALNIQ